MLAKVRFTIGKKIGLGFGLFVLFAAVVVTLTNRTLDQSRSINDEINNVYSPSVLALEDLRNLIRTSHMLIKHWALVESIPDAREKTTLVGLTEIDLPKVMLRIDSLSIYWDRDETSLMNRVVAELDILMVMHDQIKEMLPSLESYSDPIKYLERNDMAEEGGPLDEQTSKVLANLNNIIDGQEMMRNEVRGSMIRSFDSLKFFVLYMGVAMILVGIFLAIFIVRSIVKPVQRLRGILIALGNGVFPKQWIKQTNDEIGEMTKALFGLVDGLKRTTDFSHAVAAGRFDTRYEPLSEEDVLGHALLKMRDELGERERVLEEKVVERTEEVVRQKEEVEKQSKKVVELYKNVTDSIRYAKRLQDSILPPEQVMKKILPKSFVLFKPKDIVSGDFYWFEEVDGLSMFAAVDCTGHGVPGAFMSLVGHNGLNQAVKEHGLRRPAEILDDLNNIAQNSLNKGQDDISVRDGMDIALCVLDEKKNELYYAGANCPLYIVRNGALHQLKANKQPIGGFDTGRKPYTEHTISLEAGDVIYIFSDGYADQFGGPNEKKFLYRRFRETITSIHNKDMDEQKEALLETLMTWKGANEQVDDILVIGARFD